MSRNENMRKLYTKEELQDLLFILCILLAAVGYFCWYTYVSDRTNDKLHPLPAVVSNISTRK